VNPDGGRSTRQASPLFTPEQRAAIADRRGSRLLAANAGSGKTAVMVDRFVEAVLHDGMPVGAILALTFTDKAAGELRERLRRRFVDFGRADLAREAEGAWVGTIHGFCARVLRSHPLAAGLDPGFEVLDELTARRVANSAFERALDVFAAEGAAPALDLAAAYGAGLRELVLGASQELRSRGQTSPRLAVPPRVPAPDPTPLAAARARAGEALSTAKPGVRVAEALAALDACDKLVVGVRSGPVPFPGALDPATLGSGAAALKQSACDDYRNAWSFFRQACANHHARSSVELIATLLECFGTSYAEAKRQRSALDFEDLELRVRDLLQTDAGLRERWAQRYALIMVDEFQDTNRLQLDVLEALERDNLFAVGDEFQSIYGFRHADVTIFRDRRAALGPAKTKTLQVNFRSSEELLDVINLAFSGHFGERFAPLVAGRADARGAVAPAGEELRLFDPDRLQDDGATVELLLTDTRGWDEDPELEASIGLVGLAEQPWRRAEARRVARRLREEVDGGRRQGDVVVLVRATASLRILEQALEEEGLTTYVVGGRGYWSQEQVRDGLAYLRALANPLDEEALLGVLASPFAGVDSDGIILLAQAARANGRGVWAQLSGTEDAGWSAELNGEARERLGRFAERFAGERSVATRLGAEVLLERGLAITGYDLAILARPDGERRLANLRKLMRLARDYERAEGRDLRAFLDFAATQELEAAREGEAPLESEGLDAIRLMTIHRAKGLEFAVVCVADLGREPARNTDPLLIGHDGRVGLRLLTLGGGKSVPALAHEALSAEKVVAEADEERRLLYVAMTRAREKLILSGGIDAGRWPEPKPGAAPLRWVARALLGDHPAAVVSPQAPQTVRRESWRGRPAPVLAHLFTAEQADTVVSPRNRRTAPTQTVLPAVPTLDPIPAIPTRAQRRLGPARLSYSSLGDYERCPYRFYLRRVLGLGDVPEPLPPPPSVTGDPVPALDPRVRGTVVHSLLEDLDFRRPVAPTRARVELLAEAGGTALARDEIDEVIALVSAFAGSPLCGRLAAAGRSVRREAPFAFALDAAPDGPMLTGYVDVMATDHDGSVLVVDYKTDRLDPGDTPTAAVARAYGTQRLVYALAALRAGAPEVEVAHCYLELPAEEATATFTQRDAPDLGEALLGLAQGVRDARYPVTANPHREMCGSCPGRLALCSHPEERTLRPAAA
jgi:ATP-dependent helicase/nuclease subunit A